MIRERLTAIRSGSRAGWTIASVVAIGLAGTSIVALPAQVAQAATDTVTNCSSSSATVGSLPYEVANAASGDTINFALSPACSTVMLGGGTIGITKDVSIVGPGAGNLAIVGNGTAPVIGISSSVNSTSVSGLTIEGGGGTLGGGIANGGFILSVTDSIITDNSSSTEGGGIYTGGLSLTVTDSTISGNSAGIYGGGIAVSNCGGGAQITGSTISENTAMSDGGGVFNCGDLTMSNSTLAGNTVTDPASGRGGGLYNGLGGGVGTTLTNDTVWNNHSKISSGLDNEGTAANLTIGSTILADNTSTSGPSQDCGNTTLTDLGYNLADDSSCGLSGTGDLSSTPATLDPTGLRYNGGPTQTVELLATSAAIDHVRGGALSGYRPAGCYQNIAVRHRRL